MYKYWVFVLSLVCFVKNVIALKIFGFTWSLQCQDWWQQFPNSAWKCTIAHGQQCLALKSSHLLKTNLTWVSIFKTLQFFMYSSKPPNVCPAFPRWDGDVLKYSTKYFVYYPQGWFCRDRRGHWQSRSWQSELDSGRISTAQPPDKAGLTTWENTDK